MNVIKYRFSYGWHISFGLTYKDEHHEVRKKTFRLKKKTYTDYYIDEYATNLSN